MSRHRPAVPLIVRRPGAQWRKADSDEVAEGLEVRSFVSEFGTIGCLLAPVAGLVYWLWRRSRKPA